MPHETVLEFHNPRTLGSVGNQLPTADSRDIFWLDPAAEGPEMSMIETHKATFNPETGDLYSVVTDEYEVINPPQFIGPLAHELKERDRTDVNGTFHVRDGGASGYGEMLFDTGKIWPPDRNRSDEPVRTGLTLRYSHDGGISVRASGFAQDGMCKNTMRRVTDSVYVKHAGDVGGRVDWEDEWSTLLDQLGTFSENLATVIEEAMEFVVFDFSEFSFDGDWIDVTDPHDALAEEVSGPVGVSDRQVRGLHGFFEFLGFPLYLCLSATDRAVWRMAQSEEPRTLTAWDAYSALTYALTHEGRFEDGSSSDDRYHRIASEVLTNPPKAREDAERELLRRVQPEPEQDVLGVEETVGEAMLAYEQREDQLRGSLE